MQVIFYFKRNLELITFCLEMSFAKLAAIYICGFCHCLSQGIFEMIPIGCS